MLNLYKNIRELRKLNKWTQEDLAHRMGYTDRSMIAKIESGVVDLSQSKIMEFARVFGVDPGDLMGYDGTEFLPDVYLEDDRALLEMYHNVPQEVRSMVDYLLKSAQQDVADQDQPDDNNE